MFLNLIPVFSQEKSLPIKIEAAYVGEYFNNFSGGIKTGQTYLGLIDFGIGINTGDIGLWKNGEFFALVENTHGGSPSGNFIGDLQVASNIENGDFTYLYELWYMQQFNKLGVKLGLLDLNADCHVSEIGGLFLNSSFGIMPSASVNMPVPIFPLPALGIQLKYDFTERFSVLAGAWDGDPGDFENNRYNIEWTLDNRDGFLYMFEGQYNYDRHESGFGNIKLGALYHSGTFENITDTTLTKKGNLQFHLIAEQTLIKKAEGEKGKLDAFLQIGYLPDKNINHVPFYFGVGINYTGLLLKSGTDVLGLGIAHVAISKKLVDDLPTVQSYEMAIELSYALPLVQQITIQPDLQYIINPGGTSEFNNAFAGFVRIIIEY